MPQLIIPIKTALNTRSTPVIVKVLKVLQALVACDCVPEGQHLIGQALVPYYRQILPVLNIFVRSNDNLGDGIDYGQQRRENLGELIAETLEHFEVHGGEDAFINVKSLVPVSQSVVVACGGRWTPLSSRRVDRRGHNKTLPRLSRATRGGWSSSSS